MRAASLLAAAVLLATLLAGCGQAPAPSSPTANRPVPRGAAEILAHLDAPTRPSAERAVDDLAAFVALAPRRYENQFQQPQARDWLEAQFKAAGLNVTRHGFDGKSQLTNQAVRGENIIATKPGRDPSRILLFGGHYDSAVTAYGAAYDDGSGTLLTVELARALARYNWTHTLVFAAWDQEESGLVGSAAWVQQALERNVTVDLALNFDMAGINWPAKFLGAVDEPVKVDFGGTGDARYAADWMAAVAHLGHPESSTKVATNATPGSSDHGSFLAAKMPAAWIRGAVIGNYPPYHNADSVETMVADVGGNRSDLVAGFDTILQTVFEFTFLADAGV